MAEDIKITLLKTELEKLLRYAFMGSFMETLGTEPDERTETLVHLLMWTAEKHGMNKMVTREEGDITS